MNKFNVGDGASVCFFSDRHAATVVDVSEDGKRVTAQTDTATVVEGRVQDGSAEYNYERNPIGSIYRFSLRKNGRYVNVGSKMTDGPVLGIGRSHYWGPHF